MDLKEYTISFENYIKNNDMTKPQNFGIHSHSDKAFFFAKRLLKHQNFSSVLIEGDEIKKAYPSEENINQKFMDLFHEQTHLLEKEDNIILLLNNFSYLEFSQQMNLFSLLEKGIKYNEKNIPSMIIFQATPNAHIYNNISYMEKLESNVLSDNKQLIQDEQKQFEAIQKDDDDKLLKLLFAPTRTERRKF